MFRTGTGIKADWKSAAAALKTRNCSSTKLGTEREINLSFYLRKEKYAFHY